VDAIVQAEDALGHIDDSSGVVMPVIMQLRGVHERACNDLRPDEDSLVTPAQRLVYGGVVPTIRGANSNAQDEPN